MRIGIIGAGAAGLAAAYELGKHGHHAVVYDRASFLGGQASTFNVGGARLERGYHHLFTSDTDILELMEDIGLGNQIRLIESTVGTLYDGKIYNFVTPMDLLRFKPLRFIDRVRLGFSAIRLRRMKDWRALESYTADEWLKKHSGEGAYQVFWGPMLRGKFGEVYYDQVSMAWVWGKMHTRFASRGRGMSKEMLVYPIGSFGEVFDTLAAKIESHGNQVHLSTSVSRIVIEDKSVRGIEVGLRERDVQLERFDAIISTTPSNIFSRLVPSLPTRYQEKLDSVHYMSAVLVILVLDRPLSKVYWLNVADRSIPFVGVIEHTNLIGPKHYGDKHIVYLTNYLQKNHRLYNMELDELLQEYLPHLRKINPKFDPSWIHNSYHHRVDAAQPIIGTNYSERIPEHRTPIKGLYLANTTQVYPEDRGTNYSVRMGLQVAHMAMEDCKNL